MASTNLDAADLRDVDWGGLIHEDVMDTIYSLERAKTPFIDRIGEERKSKNAFRSWVKEDLEDPDLTNAVVDGSDANGNDVHMGERVGNHHQIADKVVRVSERARRVDTIGYADELAKQISGRQKALYRDVEAITLSNQASQEDDGNTTPGKVGGVIAWFETNVVGGSGATAGGFNKTTGVVDAYSPGTKQALSETNVRLGMELAVEQGGQPSFLMAPLKVISAFSAYLLSATARVATIMTDGRDGYSKTSRDDVPRQGARAMGSVRWFDTDYGPIELVGNYLMKPSAGNVANAILIDPEFWAMAYINKPITTALARTGLAENRQMFVDWTLMCLNEKSSALIGDIDTTLAPTA